jgi:hypothetical protein
MRASELAVPVLPTEALTIPELGGDGIVQVVGVTFGQKITISSLPVGEQATEMLAISVRDDDGNPVMHGAGWDTFGTLYEQRFIELLQAARRVSGIEVAEVKKD